MNEQVVELTNELIKTNRYGTLNAVAQHLYNVGYVKQRRGTWIDLGDQRCQCSECGSVRYGNSKACIIEYHLAPFCEKCGALLCDLTNE